MTEHNPIHAVVDGPVENRGVVDGKPDLQNLGRLSSTSLCCLFKLELIDPILVQAALTVVAISAASFWDQILSVVGAK